MSASLFVSCKQENVDSNIASADASQGRVAADLQPTLSADGVATFGVSGNIGKRRNVPDTWKKIYIKKNVTLTGSFRVPESRTTKIEIYGESRTTSIIQGDGSRPTDDGNNSSGQPYKGRTYSAIRVEGDNEVSVHDLTVTKPMKFHISGGFGKVTVERCNIIAGSETPTTDGIHGGKAQTTIRDCYIDVHDDALYTIECKLVERTTIVHNSNGGPFMTSWGAAVPANHTCIIRDCKVKANSTGYYAHGVFSWAQKNEGEDDPLNQTINIKIEGTFDYTANAGKVKAPYMYTIGRPFTGNPGAVRPPDVRNATMSIDGSCLNKNSIEYRPTVTNSKVVFKNCP